MLRDFEGEAVAVFCRAFFGSMNSPTPMLALRMFGRHFSYTQTMYFAATIAQAGEI